jgi:hypothetical protein
MIIQRTNVSLLPSLCYKAKRTVGFSPMAYNVPQVGDVDFLLTEKIN